MSWRRFDGLFMPRGLFDDFDDPPEQVPSERTPPAARAGRKPPPASAPPTSRTVGERFGPRETPPGKSAAPKAITVSQLTERIKGTLETTFTSMWVRGEISNLVRAGSGHTYFNLKDEGASLRAVLWKSAAGRVRFELEEGQETLCWGDVTVYAPRGDYQLTVKLVEPVGVGALQLAFEQLKRKLSAEGLFDPVRKKPVPRWPRTIALVTSPSGAAVRDFLQASLRRWPGLRVLVIPARVQGAGAAEDIARGIAAAHYLPVRPDALVVGRGGGSLEDLWCFNEEVVVRAVAASEIPTVSAVGHEIDVTLCDLAADVRALTPTEAAERLTPDIVELRGGLAALRHRLIKGLRTTAARARARVEALANRPVLRRPHETTRRLAQRLDEIQSRASKAVRRRAVSARQKLAAIAARLSALSPLATLSRGYSVAIDRKSGETIRSVEQVQVGDLIETRVADGAIVSRVESTHRHETPNAS